MLGMWGGVCVWGGVRVCAPWGVCGGVCGGGWVGCGCVCVGCVCVCVCFPLSEKQYV